jgi:hypothetical protein
MTKTTMYVVTHKQVDIPGTRGYIPIVVGKNEVSYSDYIRDDSGDNITTKMVEGFRTRLVSLIN